MAKRKKARKLLVDQIIADGGEHLLSDDRVIGALKRKRLGTRALAKKLKVAERELADYIADMQRRGILIQRYGSEWGVADQPFPVDHGLLHTYHSRPDHTYLFGIISDTHLGSKYERLDVLRDLYNRFAAAEVDRVFHAGNWIDGESRLNRHELHVFGLDEQCRYLAQQYPQHDGLVTYAIAGDCHEGWYGKDAKLDVGKYLEDTMRRAGRDDWCNLGFLEANVPLTNASSGKSAQLQVRHPGGGTAYAISYKPQKIVEAMAGGEKPAILILGHYHKMEIAPLRNVHVIQAGCTQDESTWTRKNNIQPVVGGWIIKATQDPRTGAIYGMQSEYFLYYNRGYYNNRWSPYGPVTKPPRRRV